MTDWVQVAAALSKPLNTIIEKIADGIGILGLPIAAASQAKADEITQRARLRREKEALREQDNLENVFKRTVPLLSENAQPEQVDPDWYVRFVKKAELYSREEIQDVWARILAGEVNSPGTFSMRLLSIVENISSKEAALFQNLCSLCSDELFHGKKLVSVCFSYREDETFLTNLGITLEGIFSLQSLGLIQATTRFSRYGLTDKEAEYIPFSINGEGFAVMQNSVETSIYALTPLGKELRKTIVIKPAEGLTDYVLNAWKLLQYHVRKISYADGSLVLGDDVVPQSNMRLVTGSKY